MEQNKKKRKATGFFPDTWVPPSRRKIEASASSSTTTAKTDEKDSSTTSAKPSVPVPVDWHTVLSVANFLLLVDDPPKQGSSELNQEIKKWYTWIQNHKQKRWSDIHPNKLQVLVMQAIQRIDWYNKWIAKHPPACEPASIGHVCFSHIQMAPSHLQLLDFLQLWGIETERKWTTEHMSAEEMPDTEYPRAWYRIAWFPYDQSETNFLPYRLFKESTDVDDIRMS
jgi:hypothetical protein